MRAAVVTSFGTPPSCQDFPAPVPGAASSSSSVSSSSEEVLVDVVAAGLHPRVRSQAAGSHYTSSDELPLIPGIDGVGRFADGTLRYFVLPDTTLGAMAEQTLVDVRRSVVLPDGTDPVVIAAAMNPAMSSWVALRRRTSFQAGLSVLVLGATGNAGRLAVEIAKHLGAGQVIAAGRNADRLAALKGADLTVSLERVGEVAGNVDVVIDYLWGEPTADAMRAIVTNRTDGDRPLTWIEVGSIAGPTAAIPSAALRAARLQIVGSGQGSVPTRDILAELPALAEAITAGAFRIDARAVPLADVETAWKETDAEQRLVITP
jgi:NADPH:quinone reductase-like Zn-dependent oxidoreductase